MTESRTEELFDVPSGLKIDEQMLFCIGSITVSWANCETLLRGLYEAIVGGKNETASLHALHAWFSHVNSHQRIGLLSRAILSSSLEDYRKEEGIKLVKKFDRYSQRRNQLAHAHYRIDPETRSLAAIEIYKVSSDSAEISESIEHFSERTVQELIVKIRLLEDLNRQFWRYLLIVKAELGSTYPMLPRLPADYLSA